MSFLRTQNSELSSNLTKQHCLTTSTWETERGLIRKTMFCVRYTRAQIHCNGKLTLLTLPRYKSPSLHRAKTSSPSVTTPILSAETDTGRLRSNHTHTPHTPHTHSRTVNSPEEARSARQDCSGSGGLEVQTRVLVPSQSYREYSWDALMSQLWKQEERINDIRVQDVGAFVTPHHSNT